MSGPVLAEGSVFGPFEVRGRLGRGGMGVVYRAFDHRHHGEVALKLLAEQVDGDTVFSERFRREARAAFELRNPYVVPVHDFGEIDGRLYISMQLIDGRDLSTIIAEGPLAPARAVGIVRQAANALGAAHRNDLIHRDVKPSNLLVVEDQDDFTYLVDFGIAHVVGQHTVATSLTSTGATIGTLAYMAPERLRGEPIDGRADTYALACVLFEMLTGRAPYPQTDQPGLIAAHLFSPAPALTSVRPDLSPAWDALIARGMAKDPAERYPTAQAFADDARRVLAGQPVPGVTAGPGSAPPPRPAAPPLWGTPPPGSVPVAPRGPVPYGTAPFGPGTPQPPPSRNGGRILAVATSLVAVALAAALVWLTVNGTVNGTGSTSASGPASTAPSVPSSAPGPVQPQSAGDLGLTRPLTTVPCTGQYAVFVGSAVDPGAYRSEVQAFLNRYPGANYLLAEQNCDSLRHFMGNGAGIYSVYYGPYPSLAEACAQKRSVGGDSYLRRLDDSTPVGAELTC